MPLYAGGIAANGYVALSELDTPLLGGNDDGLLDASDVAWPTLLVWIDGNHDGWCQPEELTPIAAAGLSLLRFDFIETRRRDSHGNEFRYRSAATMKNPAARARSVETYDVFFLRSAGD